ncbi:unnamed protein product [Linum trigynum]|uniref:Uncharacterized protein n=1 Tax=Linum trigynum TaxID=586398 RepID=A0AAV2CZB0_9ROSI
MNLIKTVGPIHHIQGILIPIEAAHMPPPHFTPTRAGPFSPSSGAGLSSFTNAQLTALEGHYSRLEARFGRERGRPGAILTSWCTSCCPVTDYTPTTRFPTLPRTSTIVECSASFLTLKHQPQFGQSPWLNS